MDYWIYPAVILAGIAAGFINTLAGSGSLITLSLMSFLGIPLDIANGSNRVGVLSQNIAGIGSFHKKKLIDWRGGLMLAVPASIGSFVGARIVADLNEDVLSIVLGIVMIVMLIVILVNPKRWLEGTLEEFEGWPSLTQLVAFFLIGVYGGFIQAGVGIFLLAGLVLNAGYNLVRANAVKMLINLIFTAVALAVFVMNDQVDWTIGILLAIGNSAGAWIAARMAVERGAEFVRYVLIAVIVISAIRFLGIDSWVMSAFG